MKISTFIDYIQNRISAKIIKEWRKGAAFETVIQSKLDDIMRTHLSTKIGVINRVDGQRVVQQQGKYSIMSPNIELYRGPYDLPKIRENRFTYLENYQQTRQTADLNTSNKRFVFKNGASRYQDTTYWIELKVESPDTHLFGGKALNDAWLDDLHKLQLQKQMDALIPGQAEINIKRYWLVMIAISPEMRAALKNGYYNHAGDLREWNEQGFSIAVGWSDLSRQGAVGVMAF